MKRIASLLLALGLLSSARAVDVAPFQAGDQEITIGTGGTVDARDSFAGLNLGYSWFQSSTNAIVLRQTLESTTQQGQKGWNGSTRIAFDHHLLGTGAVRPFVGANFGGIYGDDNHHHAFTVGVEAGAKVYVHKRVFLYAMADYSWQFVRAVKVGDGLSDGHVNWSAGVGYRF